MSQAPQESLTTNSTFETTGSLTPDVRDVAVGSIALQELSTFDDDRWLGDGGACPQE